MIDRLLHYQRDHADRIADALVRLGVAADTSDPGTGKTFVAVATAVRLGLRLVVVAPKAVLPAWRRVAALLGSDVIAIINYEAVKTGKSGLGRFENGEFVWDLPPDALLVFDECQRCKARDSQNAKLLIAAKRQRIRMLLLSATAASNPLEMRAFGFALGLHNLRGYWAWARAHGVSKGRFGMEFDGDPEHLARIHRRIFDDLRAGSRMRIAEIPDFPETQIIAEPVDTGRELEIQAIYDELKEELNKALGREDLDKQEEIAGQLDARAANHLTIQLRARQDIERLRIDTLASLATDAVAEGIHDPFSEAQTVSISTVFNDTYARSVKSKHRLLAVAKWEPPKEPTAMDRLMGQAVEPQTDEIKIATLWMVSPPSPEGGEEAKPDGTWAAYPQYDVFWNLAHAPRRQVPAAPPKPITLRTGLIGGLADSIFNAILSPINDANSKVQAFLKASTYKGEFWTV